MDIHQVISGALNSGESPFAVGSVEGINFTACAIGCDVVILSPDFQRVQILSGQIYGNVQVTCVDCCSESGKIAAVYQQVVRIFEPTPLQNTPSSHKLDYQWFETSSFSAEGPIHSISCNLSGLRLLLGSEATLQLWQHRWLAESTRGSLKTPVIFQIDNTDVQPCMSPEPLWERVWITSLANPVRHLKFSPDGCLFATAEANDRLVKVWYEERSDAGDNCFSFTYLPHPKPVTGLEWRKCGRYMPSGCVGNVLATWCEDHICRIWCETPFPDSPARISDANTQVEETPSENPSKDSVGEGPKSMDDGKRQMKRLKDTRKKIVKRLKHLRNVNSRKGSGPVYGIATATPPEQEAVRPPPLSAVSETASLADVIGPSHIHFHLATSINAEKDCFLVPSMDSYPGHLTLGIHWLNNKALLFSLRVEKILAEAFSTADKLEQRENSVESSISLVTLDVSGRDSLKDSGLPRSSEGDAFGDIMENGGNYTNAEAMARASASPTASGLSGPINIGSASKDILDLKMEAVLRDWYHSSDVLFGIHPIDGSLLIWTIEWLDDLTRQPIVSFSSRLPHAFPATDAVSLQHNVATFNPHDPSFVHLLHKSDSSQRDSAAQNTIFLLTGHQNGSLNLWNMTVDEKSQFSQIFNLEHMSRLCGHRFRIHNLVCHPVLPLLLSSSHHNIKQSREQRIQAAMKPRHRILSSSTSSANGGDAQCQYFNSELIFWKVDPVSPLCRSGGIRELARINSEKYSAFSKIAWIPAILPSFTLGSVSNSPSSCFIASDGSCLRVYQAVIDARSLLAQTNYGKNAKLVSSPSSGSGDSGNETAARADEAETFRIVSTQSTSRPGCIIELDAIVDAVHDWENIQFLHVFEEALVWNDLNRSGEEKKRRTSVSATGGAETLEEIVYLVAVEKNRDKQSWVHTWRVGICTQAVEQSNLPTEVAQDITSTNSSRKLMVFSEKVGSQPLSLPNGVKVLEVCAAAGHLPSSSIYPACLAPYLFSTSCSDDHIRFWYCRLVESECKVTYNWCQWQMGDEDKSSLEMDGVLLCISSSYSGRMACVYDPSRMIGTGALLPDSLNVQVAIYECESSGGTEWLQEDLISMRNVKIPKVHQQVESMGDVPLQSPVENIIVDFTDRLDGTSLIKKIPSIPNLSLYHTTLKRVASDLNLNSVAALRRKKVVSLDWVSTEDGSHILTVGVGPKIYLFAPVSENVAQQNVTIMRESEAHKRPLLRKMSSIAGEMMTKKLVHWVNLRTLELQSVDNLPPIPVMISWVRDGILVVGMESEMRIYSQWNTQLPMVEAGHQDSPPPVEKPIVRAASANFLLQHGGATETSKLASAERKATGPTSPFLSVVGPINQLIMTPSRSVLDLTKRGKDSHGGSSGTRPSKKIHSEKPFSISSNAKDSVASAMVDVVKDEGLFEAARMASPMLPQYHPKQLIELLNAGKVKRVKAILLHLLNTVTARRVGGPSVGLTRQPTARRNSDDQGDVEDEPAGPRPRSYSRGKIEPFLTSASEETMLDYLEIDFIPPLPLHLLNTADHWHAGMERKKSHEGEEDLFGGQENVEELDETFEETNTSPRRKSMGGAAEHNSLIGFTPKHSRFLTSLLTHIHLPGLSGADQMHLLAVADTVSSFSQDIFDRVSQMANSAVAKTSVAESNSGMGYANVGSSADTVDECGLRFLIALKQHEYLLKCLPMVQRSRLRQRGMSSANIIWALHSDTETEILSSIPSFQRGNPTWEDLRSVGVVWWLKNVSALRLCVEKVAKTAFQAKNDPMDSAIYYLAMRKKNILAGLFKSVRDTKMTEFFSHDFTTDQWRKAAMKNAFVLIGKQRFTDAVAFFLLGGALSDALQVCTTKLNDLQLALLIVRLQETDPERSSVLIRQLLNDNVIGERATSDPFLRSMAHWHLKEYYKALQTLIDAPVELDSDEPSPAAESMSGMACDVFNFYIFLRRHPLVVRQRLAESGVTVSTTESFLQIANDLENEVSVAERKLFFKAACTHLRSGCALLALEVLRKLPTKTTSGKALGSLAIRASAGSVISKPSISIDRPTESPQKAVDFDWGYKPPMEIGSTDKIDEELTLNWSDEEAANEEEPPPPSIVAPPRPSNSEEIQPNSQAANKQGAVVDVMVQQLKFIACLKILMEELATLASGYEVEGGTLRRQLYFWLQKEADILNKICQINADSGFLLEDIVEPDATELLVPKLSKGDRTEITAKLERAAKRRQWLQSHQSLLRTMAAYCGLHSSQGVGLVSVRMELLLLLQELHQEPVQFRQLTSPMPLSKVFPLVSAAISSYRTDVADPIKVLQGQSIDLLQSVCEFREPPSVDNQFSKLCLLYNAAQALSSCIYESLCTTEGFTYNRSDMSSIGARKRTTSSMSGTGDLDSAEVLSHPSKWPGVQSICALLSRERDEDAPNLLVLLAEAWTSVFMALLAYSLAAYDSRWLYRICAHDVDELMFAAIFGGGGDRQPLQKEGERQRIDSDDGKQPRSIDKGTDDPNKLRSRLNVRILGPPRKPNVLAVASPAGQSVATRERWVPPRLSMMAYFTERPSRKEEGELSFDYDSDNPPSSDEEDESDDQSTKDGVMPTGKLSQQHLWPRSYAWGILRLAVVKQAVVKLEKFLNVCGIDDLPGTTPYVHRCIMVMQSWISQLTADLENFMGGCPINFLPFQFTEPQSGNGPAIQKYRVILEPNNTPFGTEVSALPVKRLWHYLVRQECVMDVFIRYIFKGSSAASFGDTTKVSAEEEGIPNALRIVHRDQDPITAFSFNQANPGWLVVATTREMQEMDISHLFLNPLDWVNDSSQLDLLSLTHKKAPLTDNDDFLLTPSVKNDEGIGKESTGANRSASRLCKRPIAGIRRLDSHPTLPYYASGSGDGSVRMWEWGLAQPLYSLRQAGQNAKVTRIKFSPYGNKLGTTDGDGFLTLWQVSNGAGVRKPYLNVRCHSKGAADFGFINHSSSLLATCGHSTGDINICLWDTLLPREKSIVQSFQCHNEGAQCLMYVPGQEALYSGGKAGEICVFDIRQLRLRKCVRLFDHSAVKSLALDPSGECFVAGSADGDIKVLSMATLEVISCFLNEHGAKASFGGLRGVSASSFSQGVTKIQLNDQHKMVSCGGDGSLKLRDLSCFFGF